ncbi:hypothetical protein PTKIN_Ptkin07bG0303200 [Pterospermum kingtungense]
MEATINLCQTSRRLLRRDQIVPQNNHSSNQTVDRILVTLIVAMAILCLIFFVIHKCIHRSNNENPTEPKPSIDIELEAIPVLVFGSESTPSSEIENCPICLEEYVNGDRLRVLPRCNHMFHKSCIEKWLQVPSLYCPICRDQILEHRLQSAGSNNCSNQSTGTGLNFTGMRYTSFPSLIRGNFI